MRGLLRSIGVMAVGWFLVMAAFWVLMMAVLKVLGLIE